MPKTKIIIILTVLAGFLLAPALLWAQTETANPEIPLQIKIPIFSSPCVDQVKYPGRNCVSDFGDYIGRFYKYFSGVIGILAAAMIVFGGFQWVTASGNASRIQNAKTTITGALVGVVLTLCAYVFLNTINPDLVSLRFPNLSNITRQVLGTNFCVDLPTQSGLPLVTDPEHIPCGQYRGFDQSKSTTTYTQDYCCGNWCGPDEDGNSQVCAIASGASVDKKCPETCQSPKKICEDADVSQCKQVDSSFASQGINSVCRQLDRTSFVRTGVSDTCRYGEIAKSPCSTDGSLKKVACNYSGINKDFDTPCWNASGARYLAIGVAKTVGTVTYRYWCNSTDRIGVDTDSFCCAQIRKQDIKCLSESEGAAQKDYVEVSCTTAMADLGYSLSFNSMPGNYADSSVSTCDGGRRCYMQLSLRYSTYTYK
ncbi:MAG: pilin [Patescibacteria group bacterium]